MEHPCYSLRTVLELLQEYLVAHPERSNAPLYFWNYAYQEACPADKIFISDDIFCIEGHKGMKIPEEECEPKSYTCRHCSADLDRGDIYEVLKKQNEEIAPAHLQKSDADIRRAAKSHGWTEKNRLHFSAEVIVQPDRGEQYMECPQCKGRDPLTTEKQE